VGRSYASLCKVGQGPQVHLKYASYGFVVPQVVFRVTRGGVEITNNQLWSKLEAANRTHPGQCGLNLRAKSRKADDNSDKSGNSATLLVKYHARPNTDIIVFPFIIVRVVYTFLWFPCSFLAYYVFLKIIIGRSHSIRMPRTLSVRNSDFITGVTFSK
jgi:hypothetical protein